VLLVPHAALIPAYSVSASGWLHGPSSPFRMGRLIMEHSQVSPRMCLWLSALASEHSHAWRLHPGRNPVAQDCRRPSSNSFFLVYYSYMHAALDG